MEWKSFSVFVLAMLAFSGLAFADTSSVQFDILDANDMVISQTSASAGQSVSVPGTPEYTVTVMELFPSIVALSDGSQTFYLETGQVYDPVQANKLKPTSISISVSAPTAYFDILNANEVVIGHESAIVGQAV